MDEYPSGAIRRIIQVKVDATGRTIPDGIWTEWHEGGEPQRYVEVFGGVPAGADVAWDADGRVISE